jgi:flagellar basal-body rod protein FlgB
MVAPLVTEPFAKTTMRNLEPSLSTLLSPSGDANQVVVPEIVPARPPSCSIDPVMLDPTTVNLEHYMDLLSTRQKLVASNIANADTPGYKAQDIDFQFEFMSLVSGQRPQTIESEDLTEKPDGNNVSIDREARMLAENAMRFNVASTLVRGQLKTIREAIDEGKS